MKRKMKMKKACALALLASLALQASPMTYRLHLVAYVRPVATVSANLLTGDVTLEQCNVEATLDVAYADELATVSVTAP